MKTLRSVLTWIILIAQAVYLASVWRSLPAMLPSHFGLNGVANRHAPKQFLWVVIGISILLAVVLTVIQRFPNAFNLPKPVGDPDRPRLEALGRELILWIRLETACIFAFLVWSTVQVGMNKSGGVGNSFVVVTFAVVALTVVYFIWRMRAPQPEHRA